MSKKTLWEDDWLKVVKIDDWYTAYEQKKGHGVSVLILNPATKKVLVRNEHTPPHGSGLNKTSITGMMDVKGEAPAETAAREVKEETGIDCKAEDLISLGWVHPSKASNFKLHLFCLTRDNEETGEIVGDGTKGEEDATVEWISMNDALKTRSMDISACLARVLLMGV